MKTEVKTEVKAEVKAEIKTERPAAIDSALAAANAAKAMAARIQAAMAHGPAPVQPVHPVCKSALPSPAPVWKNPPPVTQEEEDPLDAFMKTNTKKAQKDLLKAVENQKKDNEALAKGLALEAKARDGMDEPEIVRDQTISNYETKAREVCFACKEVGHNQTECPNLVCNHCKKVGHKRSECPEYETFIKEEAKEKKREKQKEAKRRKKIDDWTKELRDKSGVQGFAALYKILELPERKLASLDDIRSAYKRMSLLWHPDKHPDNVEEATEKFLGIKAAYELLEEGIRTGGKGMGGAVFSAGDLFAPGQKKDVNANQGGVILLH